MTESKLHPSPPLDPKKVMVLDDETHFRRICTQLAACAGQQANESELKVGAGPGVCWVWRVLGLAMPALARAGSGHARWPLTVKRWLAGRTLRRPCGVGSCGGGSRLSVLPAGMPWRAAAAASVRLRRGLSTPCIVPSAAPFWGMPVIPHKAHHASCRPVLWPLPHSTHPTPTHRLCWGSAARGATGCGAACARCW